MNINRFFSKECPACGKSLTLYLQVLDGPLWRGSEDSIDTYCFRQIRGKDQKLTQDDFFQIRNSESSANFIFSSPKIYQSSKTWNFFFFLMCNEDAIEDSHHEEYCINPDVICYYRSSPFFEFRKTPENNWEMVPLYGVDYIEDDFKDEICTFHIPNANGKKTYILNIDYENKKLIVRYYAITEEQIKDEYFDPSILKLDLPMPSVRLNFDLSQRERLISRLDSWILMS